MAKIGKLKGAAGLENKVPKVKRERDIVAGAVHTSAYGRHSIRPKPFDERN